MRRVLTRTAVLTAVSAAAFAASAAPAVADDDNRCADSTVCVYLDALNPAPVPEPDPDDEAWPGYHMPDLW